VKLQEVKSVKNETEINQSVQSFIAEMTAYGYAKRDSWYMINENTTEWELNQNKLNEGIRDVLRAGAKKFGKFFGKLKDANDDVIRKAYSEVQSRMSSSEKSELMNKVMKFAKDNAQYAKPMLIAAVVGASLLGMDNAAAADVANSLDQMSGQELASALDGFDITGGEVTAGGDAGLVDNMKHAIGKQFLGAQLTGGYKVTPDDIAKAMNMIEIDGVRFDNYLNQAIEYAQKNNLSPQSLIKHIKPQVDNQMLSALHKVVKS